MNTTYEVRVKRDKENEVGVAIGTVPTLQFARHIARKSSGLVRIFTKAEGSDGDISIIRIDHYFAGEKISEKVWLEITRLMNK